MSKGLLEWLIVIMGVQVVLALTRVGFSLGYIEAIDGVYTTLLNTGDWGGIGKYNDIMLAQDWMDIIATIVLGVPALILLILHAYRHLNFLEQSGRKGLQFSPQWAIAWWFIPVANMVMPLLVLQELYRASSQEDTGWRSKPWSKTLTAWWVLNLAGAGSELWRHLTLSRFRAVHENDLALDATLEFIHGPMTLALAVNNFFTLAALLMGLLAMVQLMKRLSG